MRTSFVVAATVGTALVALMIAVPLQAEDVVEETTAGRPTGEDATDQVTREDLAESPPGDAPPASELLNQFDELYKSSGTVAEFEITIEKPDKTRAMEARSWSKGEEKALILIESPPRDAGTATLRVGDNLWNYLPKISRTIRIPPSMMMNSWMGSDLTNDDLVRESSYEEDYNAEATEWSEDPPGWLVVLTPKPDVPGLWNRLELVFETEHRLPVVARYYDRKDRLARTMIFDEAKRLDGRLVPTRMTVIDQQEEGEQTVLIYRDVEWNVPLDESRFSLSALERLR